MMVKNHLIQRRRMLKRIFFALLYGVLSAIGVNFFLTHANSYSSGLLGISQLVQAIGLTMGIHLNLGMLVFIFNVPLFIFAWRVFGLSYIFYSGLAVLFNVIALAIIPVVKLVSDPLTNTIVGATLIGVGIGLCFNNGFTTGGVDIIVTYCQRKFHKNVGFFANVVNGLILAAAVIAFGPSRIVYSLIGMLLTNWMMDWVFVSQTDVSVTIFTKQADKLIPALKTFTHGATVLHGIGAYTGNETDVIIVVTPRSQLVDLRKMVKTIDPNVFLSMQRTNVELGVYRRHSLWWETGRKINWKKQERC